MSEAITSTLKVGDKVEDDSLVILDEDRLCYSVRSVSNGGVGVRTISKALLAEWVEAYKQTPNAPSQTVRERLVGKSEIDRFEYGYAGTLAKMAKMILGQIPVVHPNAEEVRQNEFYNWMLQVEKKSPKTAKDTARTYLPSISDDAEPRTASIWHGLREYLYNEKPSKRLYAIDSLAELDAVYGGINRVFQQDGEAGTLDPQRFKECKEWANSPKNHNSVRAAWAMYKRFMQWREVQNKTKDEPPFENVDRLDVALKIFAEKRAVDKPSGWDSYDAWTKGVREEFSQVDESLLTKPGFDYVAYLRKFAISWQVVHTMFSSHSDDEKHEILKFLREQKESPKSVSWYIDDANRLEVGGNRVDRMSAKTLLYFMSELRPAEFAPWTEPTYEGLAFLGLHKGPAPKELTVETYEDCKAKQHQIVARMKELGIGKASDDATDPDYRTVNEFLWWLGQDDNKDLIKEKIMAKEFKNVSKKAKTGERKLSKAVENDEMLQRLMAALRTKPFAILAGHSGTGKSQLVRRLAYMTCNDEGLLAERNDYNAPGNYCMVQVKPNWHDSTDLLGYYTEMNGGKYHTTSFVEFICKAYAYPETPFFVCLDEMNLAPVEQYFAEFLSAIESYSETTKCTDRLITEKASPEEICGETKLTESLEEVKKHGLTIPRNLFVVGTVNVDETTCQFSRKVLDRAMTILMTAVSFKSMTEPNDPSKEKCLDPDGIRFFLERPMQTALVPGQMDRLDEVQKQIGDTPFAIAYRFANEYALYQAAYQILMDKGVGSDGKPDLNDAESQKTALDHVVLMKLLPRIHGERRVVEGIFKGRKVKGQDGDRDLQGLRAKIPDGLSAEMMDKILARPDEYLTFWP